MLPLIVYVFVLQPDKFVLEQLKPSDVDQAMKLEVLRTFVENPRSSLQIVVLLLTIVSCSAVILQTLPDLHQTSLFFFWLEAVVTVIFTFELLLRLLAAESLLDFFTDLFNWIDLLAVLPGYVEFALCRNLTLHTMLASPILRIMWLIRIFRFLKLTRKCPTLALCSAMFFHVLNSSALAILAILSFLIIVSASLLYLVESDRCEELGLPCHGFESIPSSFWFSTITLTTVGYGDVYPFTQMGRTIAAFLAVCAVILMSLSTALLSVNFERSKGYLDLETSEQEMLRDLKKAPLLQLKAMPQLLLVVGVVVLRVPKSSF